MLITFWILFIANPLIPSLLGWDQFFSSTAMKWCEAVGLGLTVLLQIVSCIYLTIAMLIISKVVKEKIGVKINLQTLILHLSSYYIYLISFIAYYIEELFYIFVKDPLDLHTEVILWVDEFRLISSVLSQLILIYVFN